jgi:hypothetical protein
VGGKAQQRGDFKTAARHYLTYLYRNGRDVRVIYALARCYARMGDADSAVALLKRAAERGFAHPDLLKSDKEFDPIRDSRAFRSHEKALDTLSGTLGQTVAVSGPRVHVYRMRLPACGGSPRQREQRGQPHAVDADRGVPGDDLRGAGGSVPEDGPGGPRR